MRSLHCGLSACTSEQKLRVMDEHASPSPPGAQKNYLIVFSMFLLGVLVQAHVFGIHKNLHRAHTQTTKDISNRLCAIFLPLSFTVTVVCLMTCVKIPFEAISSLCFHLAPDIDECETNSHHCNPTQVCINTAGGYTCSCTEGYWLIGGQCQGR